MTFEKIPSGTAVFIDANIFVYHFSGWSQECRDLLCRCERREITGVTSIIIIAEISHRLMILEAIDKDLISRSNAVKKLKKHPEIVQKLTRHIQNTVEIKEMGIQILPVTYSDYESSSEIRKCYGFLTNDSINLALMQIHDITQIATNDSDYERVSDIEVFKPTDVIVQSGKSQRE